MWFFAFTFCWIYDRSAIAANNFIALLCYSTGKTNESLAMILAKGSEKPKKPGKASLSNRYFRWPKKSSSLVVQYFLSSLLVWDGDMHSLIH